MTPRPKTPLVAAGGYCRASTTEQDISLDAQRDRIEQYCTAHNLTLAHVYVDAGVSGGVPLHQRPEGAALLAAIARREITIVVGLKLDRIFRSTIDALTVVGAWDRQKVRLCLLDFAGGELDTRTSAGRLMLTMVSAFAEMERSLIGERTSSALRHMQRQGVRLGGVPFGFTTSTPGGPLEPDAAELATAAEILRLRGEDGATASYRAIARSLTAAGIPTRHGGEWQPQTIKRIVERRALYASAETP